MEMERSLAGKRRLSSSIVKNGLKRILSYVWPQTQKVASDENGELEITWMNGRKILDSRHTNYSYGSLQRVLEEGISNVNLSAVDRILVLGLGGGCVIKSLREKFGFKGLVVAVDSDREIIKIAAREFGVVPTPDLEIVHADASRFMREHSALYDLIIVDLFIDRVIPEQFLSAAFCSCLSERLRGQGAILFNLGIDVDPMSSPSQVSTFFKNHPLFETMVLEQVQGRSLLLVAKAKS